MGRRVAMEPFLYHLRLATPIVLAWLAWVVGRTPHQERANRILAGFLALVALGFALEFFWWFFGTGAQGAGVVVRDLQNVAGAIDPPLLLAYALAFPQPRRALRSLLLWVPYGGLMVLFAVGGLAAVGLLAQPGWALAHIVYVNGTYLAAFLLLAVGYLREPRRYLARQLRFLTVGVGFAALSRSGALYFAGGPDWFQPGSQDAGIGWALVTAMALGLLLLSGLVAFGRREDRSVGRIAVPLVLALLGFFLFWWLVLQADRVIGAGGVLASNYYGYRWVFFAMIVGYGILRYQLFDFELRVRQAVTLLVGVPLLVLLAMLAGAVAQEKGAAQQAARAVALAVFLVAGLPVYLGLRAVAGLLMRDAPPQFEKRRLEIYEATLEYALQKKEWSEEERRFVETLREVFEVSPEEHRAVADRVRRASERAAA